MLEYEYHMLIWYTTDLPKCLKFCGYVLCVSRTKFEHSSNVCANIKIFQKYVSNIIRKIFNKILLVNFGLYDFHIMFGKKVKNLFFKSNDLCVINYYDLLLIWKNVGVATKTIKIGNIMQTNLKSFYNLHLQSQYQISLKPKLS